MTATESVVDRLKAEVKKFEQLQRRFSAWGASDTEPDGVFQVKMVRAFKGKKPQVPLNGNEWDLYDSSMDCTYPTVELSKQLRVILDIIEGCTLRDSHEVEKYLRDYCWRVDW